MSGVTGVAKALGRALRMREGGARHYADYRAAAEKLRRKMATHHIHDGFLLALGHGTHSHVMSELVSVEDRIDRVITHDRFLARTGGAGLTFPSRQKITAGAWDERDVEQYEHDVSSRPEAIRAQEDYREEFLAEQAEKRARNAPKAGRGGPAAPDDKGKGKEKED